MAVKIRLARRGRKKQVMFDLVIADERAPRDGRYIEKIGTFNPRTQPVTVNLDEQKAFEWLMKGAQPTDTARTLLSSKGILLRRHLQIGVLKGALTQEQADGKLQEWKQSQTAKVENSLNSLAKKKTDEQKARQEAETKVKEARAEKIKKKYQVEAPVAEEASEQATSESSETSSAVEDTNEAPAGATLASSETIDDTETKG